MAMQPQMVNTYALFGCIQDVGAKRSAIFVDGEKVEAFILGEFSYLKPCDFLVGEGLAHCAECEEPIPEARRAALPGVKLCIDCMQERDAGFKVRSGINRRGSKDSQLR